MNAKVKDEIEQLISKCICPNAAKQFGGFLLLDPDCLEHGDGSAPRTPENPYGRRLRK